MDSVIRPAFHSFPRPPLLLPFHAPMPYAPHIREGKPKNNVALLVALFAPLLAAILLFATRDRDTLHRAQTPYVPEWLVQEDGVAPRRYTDGHGRDWWRYDPDPVTGRVFIAPPPTEFPEGCVAAWFVRRGTPLSLRPSSDAEPLPIPASGRVRSGKVLFHRLTGEAIANGASLELTDPARSESLFVAFAPERIHALEAGYVLPNAWGGDRGRSLFAALSAAFAILVAAFVVRYRSTGSAATGVAAIAAAFALGALWFDSPIWSREGRIDKGDDSFYLAYAQNLANHGAFFRAPTDIRFGVRHLDHCHGLPGISLMLSPPLLARALPGGAARRGTPIDAGELRAMRTTSMAYALLAMLFLFGALRSRRGGAGQPSAWDVLLPVLLLLGTSLTRWAFVRSIFTHPAELALLCLALFLASRPCRRRAAIRDIALAATAGLLSLARGEYLPVAPLFLLLPRREPAASGATTFGARARVFIRRHGAPLLVLAAFAGVYLYWISQISTGYGRPSDSKLPFADGASAVLGQILRNARVLLRSFVQNGALLPASALLAIAAPFIPALRRRACDLPTSPRATAVLAGLLFLLNCCFTPPLGDEFGHRYALKLYPFALMWLGTLLSGPSPAPRAGRAARALLSLLPLCALAANLRLLLQTDAADFGQNFSMLSNLQLAVMPPCGSGALNLRATLWMLLAAWCAWLIAEARRLYRDRPQTPDTRH